MLGKALPTAGSLLSVIEWRFQTTGSLGQSRSRCVVFVILPRGPFISTSTAHRPPQLAARARRSATLATTYTQSAKNSLTEAGWQAVRSDSKSRRTAVSDSSRGGRPRKMSTRSIPRWSETSRPSRCGVRAVHGTQEQGNIFFVAAVAPYRVDRKF